MRVHNWPLALSAVLLEWRAYSFDWGRTDCCQFVGAVCLAITGEDRRDLFAGYDSEMGAARLLVTHGGMEGLLTYAFGEPKPAVMARRGDCVLCEFGAGAQPAIVEGAYCWAPTAKGLIRRRVIGDGHYPDAVLGWSIG